MKKNFFYFLLPVMFLAACCPGGEDHTYMKVTDYLQESVPYQTGQTIRFTSSEGENYTLSVKRTLEQVENEFNSCSKETKEFFNLQLTNNQATPVITLGTNYTTDEQMTIEVLTKNLGGLRQYYIFHYYLNEDGSFECGEKFNFLYTCHETLNIGGKNYSDVLEINQKELDPNGENNILRLFYSQTKGVLQYEFVNGVIYTFSEV